MEFSFCANAELGVVQSLLPPIADPWQLKLMDWKEQIAKSTFKPYDILARDIENLS